MDTDASAAKSGETEGGPGQTRSAVAFLIPTFKTPYLTSDLLATAHSCGTFGKCAFILLLLKEDPFLLTYRETVENLRAKGLNVGFIVIDGTSYAGMVNRIAPLVDADCVCVIDSRHLPAVKDNGDVGEAVTKFMAESAQQMQVATFTEAGFFPVVTQKFIERLGYMFHPLAYGRLEAENWLLNLSTELGILRQMPDCTILESSADGVEIIGVGDPSDTRWVDETLEQALEDEVARLDSYLLK